MAALTRDLSTMLNGMQVDEPQFRRDVDHLVKGARAAAKPRRRPPQDRPPRSDNETAEQRRPRPRPGHQGQKRPGGSLPGLFCVK